MKRRNVQMAFIGEGLSNSMDSIDGTSRGDEAIDVKVTGGKLLVVVPARTPDERMFDEASVLGGELILENGQRFSFEINDGATGAQFSADGRSAHEDKHPDLSTLPNIPSGT